MVHGRKKTAKARMTNERMLRLILQEIADVRMELKGDIAALDMKLSGRIDSVATDLAGLRAQVHQNQVSFMSYMNRTDKRLGRVEEKVR